jgi:hypothetical protein
LPSITFLRNISFLHNVQNVSEALPTIVDTLLGIQRPKREADYSCPTNAEVKKVLSLNSTSIHAYGAVLKNIKNYLSVYDFTDFLLDLGRFFRFLILYTVDRTPWTGEQPVVRPLPTHRTTHTHPCLERDSNPRSQRSSERRQFMT